MAWKLSQFRAGALVEVRSEAEILATLDRQGRLDGMPFMPEMLQFCGRQFRVRAVAHKTCDTAKQTYTGRRLDEAVHLDDLRCDGSAHDGCQAECSLFWKDAWLKPAGAGAVGGTVSPPSAGCTVTDLQGATRSGPAPGESGGTTYYCQATNLYDFTEHLAEWNPRQYVYDVVTGNQPAGHVLGVVSLTWLRRMLPRVRFGYRWFKAFHDWMHVKVTGRGSPSLNPKIAAGGSTPRGRLDLRPGEWVRIRSQAEIEETIDVTGKNRGLSFDHEEMAPFCGGTYQVRQSITKIIDEPTGKMIEMKQPCITMEGVVCRSEYAKCRLNCPRAIPSFWRELWLERVGPPAPSA